MPKQKPAIIATPYPTIREVGTTLGMTVKQLKSSVERYVGKKLTLKEFNTLVDKRR